MSTFSESDKIKLKQIAENGALISETNTFGDIENKSPGRLNPEESFALIQLAVETTNAKAAAEIGCSERTVERHRAYWFNTSDSEAVRLTNCNEVDDRMCGAMRCAAESGESLSEIAQRFGLVKTTVFNHVSVSTSQKCNHDIPVTVSRVELDHGGFRNRERNESGEFI